MIIWKQILLKIITNLKSGIEHLREWHEFPGIIKFPLFSFPEMIVSPVEKSISPQSRKTNTIIFYVTR